MKKELLLLLLFVFCLADTTTAQISDRQNDESTYLFGARPDAGTYGFYIGMSTVDIADLIDSTVAVKGIPIINIKWYKTDQLVLKAGIQITKKRRSIEGSLDSTYDAFETRREYKHVETDASWRVMAGLEKHFDLSNIYDAYVGLNGDIGYARSVRTNNITYAGGDYENDEGSNFGFTYGGEVILGMNFFIADLPVAIGFEWGSSFKNYGASKYKYEYSRLENGQSSSGTYYTSLLTDFDDEYANSFSNNDTRFTDLKVRRFDVLPVARVTFTYYFK